MSILPPTVDALEQQLAALRDQARALDPYALPDELAAKVAFVLDEVEEATLLLRRPTRSHREGVTVIVAQMHRLLAAVRAEGPRPSGLVDP